jgi:hypothetical protein
MYLLQLYRRAESRVQPQGRGGGQAGHQPKEFGPLLGLRLHQRGQEQTAPHSHALFTHRFQFLTARFPTSVPDP